MPVCAPEQEALAVQEEWTALLELIPSVAVPVRNFIDLRAGDAQRAACRVQGRIGRRPELRIKEGREGASNLLPPGRHPHSADRLSDCPTVSVDQSNRQIPLD